MIAIISLRMDEVKSMDADGTMFRIEVEVRENGHLASVSVPDHTQVLNQSHVSVKTVRDEHIFSVRRCV